MWSRYYDPCIILEYFEWTIYMPYHIFILERKTENVIQ